MFTGNCNGNGHGAGPSVVPDEEDEAARGRHIYWLRPGSEEEKQWLDRKASAAASRPKVTFDESAARWVLGQVITVRS